MYGYSFVRLEDVNTLCTEDSFALMYPADTLIREVSAGRDADHDIYHQFGLDLWAIYWLSVSDISFVHSFLK